MRLSYRGVHYEQNPLALDIDEGEIGGKYRGQDWKYHYPRHMPQLQTKSTRQYRGLAYHHPMNLVAETFSSACPIPRTQPTKIVVDEVSQVHLESIRRRLECRLEIALAKGDVQLVRLLTEESQALNLRLNVV